MQKILQNELKKNSIPDSQNAASERPSSTSFLDAKAADTENFDMNRLLVGIWLH